MMRASTVSKLFCVLLAQLATADTDARKSSPVTLSLTPPRNASEPILESFVSYSIEFSSFPDFAGNSSQPNVFSYQLLKNLQQLQGSFPIIRVGGNTQDYATYDASQSAALIGSVNVNRSKDYPTTISIGPSYFDSYSTWPGVSYVHGFNQGKNGSAGLDTLKGTVPLMCKALPGDKLAYFQIGNEPDLFKTSAQGPVRPANWDESAYVAEWLMKTRLMRDLVQENCPEVIQAGKFRFYSPAFAGVSNSLNIIKTWAAGLNSDHNIAFVDSHNYIGGAEQPGVTLQGTLMNHSSTVNSVNKHLNESSILRKQYTKLPYILGETNSLYNQGRPGLSNTFGAALWGVDFNLYCAANDIRRVHMHQGTNYRYASWSPIDTNLQSKGTKAPYYGNIMVAAFLGNLNQGEVKIADIERRGASEFEASYAGYVDGKLKRVAVLQMKQWNYTTPDAQTQRPSQTFTFQAPKMYRGKTVAVQRLIANGSDAISGITFDGYSYNYELDGGKPVMQSNVTRGECVRVGRDGRLTINVPWSSAAILNFD